MSAPGGSADSRGVRRAIVAVIIPFVLATVVGLIVLWPDGDKPTFQSAVRVDGTILEVEPCTETTDGATDGATGDVGGSADVGQSVAECRDALVRVDSGPDEGLEVNVPVPFGSGAPTFVSGDEVVLGAAMDAPSDVRYELLDFQRSQPLLVLGVAFGLAVLALSRWRGLAALAGLGLSVVVLVVFVLPALLEGKSPLAVAVTGAATIMFGTLYLTHGATVRTSVALIGTLVSLTITAVLGHVVTEVGRFTGVADESAAFLGALGENIDVRGLLLAGLVIGALGVLDDVTITQTAAVWEVAQADPEASRRTLFGAGLRIGRAHVAATVNTLVLAYAGASLPLLLLFVVVGQGVPDVITTELVAQEVVRAMVGGLGIVSAVPITTVLATMAVRAGEPVRRGRRAQRAGEPATLGGR